MDELIQATGCCTGCGGCRVHLEDFLRTGEVQVGDQRIKLPDPDRLEQPVYRKPKI